MLDKLPKKHHDDALAAPREIMYADHEQQARRGLEALAKSFQRNYPKAATCIRDDSDRMFAYYRFPRANHKNLSTTNPIESIFASVRLRTDAAKRLRTIKTATSMLFAFNFLMVARPMPIDRFATLSGRTPAARVPLALRSAYQWCTKTSSCRNVPQTATLGPYVPIGGIRVGLGRCICQCW